MKKIFVYSASLILLFVFNFLFTNNLNAQLFNQGVIKEHEILQKFSGEWYQVANYTATDGKSTTAKGTITGEILLSGTICKLQSIQGNKISVNESLIIFGYDKNLKQYYFQGYDRDGNIPTTFIGDYDPKSQRFNLETFMVDDKGNKLLTLLELWFERDDKFIYKITVNERDKKTVIAEVANIKVTDKTNEKSKKK